MNTTTRGALKHLKIATKLGAGFGALLLLLALVSALAFARIEQVSDSVDHMIRHRYPKIEQLHLIKDRMNDAMLDLRDLALHNEPDNQTRIVRHADELSTAISGHFDALEHNITSQEGKQMLATLEAARLDFRARRSAYFERMRAGQAEAGITLLQTSVARSQQQYFAAVDRLIEHEQRYMKQDGAATAALADGTGPLLLALCAGAIALGGVVAWRITRGITVPLAQAVALARRVAGGDLSASAAPASRDETGQLLLALQDMTHSLRQIVGQVRSGSDQINGAAADIAAGNLDLSSRTEQQAGALEEAASSMEQLTAAVRDNSAHAEQAHRQAEDATAAAHAGGAVVTEVVSTMDAISAAAQQITAIIGVIDGIAFQTNILALNAAVEAARAGDQGRGFAVVASEVRNLAQRSAAAAKDIKHLIEHTGQQVSQGAALVQQAGAGMDGIVQRISAVGSAMQRIVDASREQTAGIEQINGAVIQLDTMTQQNAALVEQAAAASASLQQQAGALLDGVSVFRLDHAHAAPAAPAAPARAPLRLALRAA